MEHPNEAVRLTSDDLKNRLLDLSQSVLQVHHLMPVRLLHPLAIHTFHLGKTCFDLPSFKRPLGRGMPSKEPKRREKGVAFQAPKHASLAVDEWHPMDRWK